MIAENLVSSANRIYIISCLNDVMRSTSATFTLTELKACKLTFLASQIYRFTVHRMRHHHWSLLSCRREVATVSRWLQNDINRPPPLRRHCSTQQVQPSIGFTF